MTSYLVLCYLLWQQLSITVDATGPEILEAPENLTAPIVSDPVIMPCHIRGEILYWVINNELYGTGNVQRLRDQGITITNPIRNGSELYSTATVAATIRNNNTVLVCEAQVDGLPIVSSHPASIVFAGAPLAPDPVFSVINVSSVQVEWTIPFTPSEFPIINYTVEIINQTNETLAFAVVDSDILSYIITRTAPPSCTNLTFSVIATSEVGSSMPGTAEGAFPFTPGIFLESPRHEVTYFQTDFTFTPILEVNFTFPALCAYHNASYEVVITDMNDELVLRHGPYLRHWRETSSPVTIELREEVQLNMHYTARIIVSTLAGQEYVEFTFDTLLHTQDSLPATIPVVPKDARDYGLVEIVVTCIGTLAFVMILIALSVCSIYSYRRWYTKRRRERVNITEINNQMVPNPIYDGTAIYEEIPGDIGNFRSLPDCTKDAVSAQKEEGYVSMSNSGISNWEFSIPEKCQQEEVAVLALDETYTVMNNPAAPVSDDATGNSAAMKAEPENVDTNQEERYVKL